MNTVREEFCSVEPSWKLLIKVHLELCLAFVLVGNCGCSMLHNEGPNSLIEALQLSFGTEFLSQYNKVLN